MRQMWETGHTWNFLKYLKILPVFDYCNKYYKRGDGTGKA